LKRTTKICAVLLAAVGCLIIFGQPASNSPALARTMMMIGSLALVASVSLLWVLVLRRRVAEQTAVLQQSEQKFRSLVEQSLVGVYVIQDGRFVYANPRMADIYGYSVAEMTAPSFNVRQTVADADWPMVENQIKRRMSGEIAQAHYTVRAVRKDGFLIHVEVLGSQGEYNGKPAILGTAADITERKVAEIKLAEASNLLETLLDASPDCIYFKDRSSHFVRYSKAFANLFKLSDIKNLKGKTDFDFFLPEHARPAFEDEQEIMRTGKPLIGKFEAEHHADGRVTHALTTKVPWRDPAGNIVGTFGISKDITPLKETEAKLAYEHDLFRTLLDNFPDAIYFKDLESRFVRLSRSKAVRSMNIVLAWYREEHPDAPPEELPSHLQSVENFSEWLIGKTDFDTYAKERAQTAYDDEQNIIRTGEPIVARIEKTPQADGRITWCISTKLPWRDKEGRIVGTFGVSKDITALKNAEAELESAHQRLLETSRLAGMAEVASDVLHNVGNVLNSVNVSCSLTIDRVKASKISGLAKTAALIEENRGRLGEFFTNDPRGQQIPSYLAVLAEHFSQEQSALMQELEQLLKHIEHIKQIVAMQQSYAKVAGVIETVNATQLVDDAVHINGAALTRHDVQVRCEFQPVPMIQTEKHRVLQILVNLIRNAKYALDEAKRQDKIMTVKLGRNGGDHIKIEVIDNGVGIPPENLTRIFGHGFTTRTDGHGFGLHSSAIAIKELGGSLTAHSEGIGKGATFTLLLPEKPPIQTQDFQ
jgi:PAS domain S-box-containing protein